PIGTKSGTVDRAITKRDVGGPAVMEIVAEPVEVRLPERRRTGSAGAVRLIPLPTVAGPGAQLPPQAVGGRVQPPVTAVEGTSTIAPPLVSIPAPGTEPTSGVQNAPPGSEPPRASEVESPETRTKAESTEIPSPPSPQLGPGAKMQHPGTAPEAMV